MNRRLFVASLFATLLAACQLDEKTEGPVAACFDVGAACSANEDCCSYGCASHFCVPNPEDGGLCRTSDDCAGAICLDGRCDPRATARQDGDRCDSDLQCATRTCVETANGGRGECVQNHAPVAALVSNANVDGKLPTRTPIVFDARGSSDADGDALSYGWAVVRLPSLDPVSCSNGTGYSTCTVATTQTGTYRAVVTVSDGKAPAEQATVTVEVVNLPPEIRTMALAATPAAHPASPSRNVAFRIDSTVVDPDGDPLTCSWTAKLPGATSALPIPGAPTTCNTALPYTPALEGVYEFTLTPDDGQPNAAVSRTISVTVVNDAPVIATINGTAVGLTADVYGNMGATAETTPAIALTAAATDVNLDSPLAYAWTQTGGAAVVLSAPGAATTTFVPPGEDTYTFTVTASDPADFGRQAAASAPVTVTVHVDRYVQDLQHAIVDADRAVNAEKAALVGPLPGSSTKGALWMVDLATHAEAPAIELPAPPTIVGLSPDAKVAVVATDLFYWIVDVATGTVSTNYSTGTARNDIVVTGTDNQGKRRAFLFPKTAGSIGVVDLSTGTLTTVSSTYGIAGALDPVGDRMYTVDTSYVLRYALASNGTLNGAGYASASRAASCAKIWSSRHAETNAFTGCGEIVSITPSTSLVSISGSLGSTVRHVDTATDGTGVFADSLGTVRRFSNAVVLLPANDPLPFWSDAGRRFTATASWVFIATATDGTHSSFAIVSASSADGATRYGIVALE